LGYSTDSGDKTETGRAAQHAVAGGIVGEAR
jgi:hypothetical protein